MVKSSVALNIEKLTNTIDFLTKKYQREKTPPLLLAVSKKQSVEAILNAYEAGQRHFGENYAQEMVEKATKLSHLDDIQWHFIGPIQSNKVKLISQHADWVHSVDRSKILYKLDQYRPTHKASLKVCIQVNIDAEDSKSGVPTTDINEFLSNITPLVKTDIRGLMCIPKASASLESQRQPFAKLHTLLNQNKLLHPQFNTLSMGMSSDIEAAIAEGSTILRVGTTIFGQRDVNTSESG